MGGLGVAAFSFDAWCLATAGVAFGTVNMLLTCSLAASSMTQVAALWQDIAVRGLTERETAVLDQL